MDWLKKRWQKKVSTSCTFINYYERRAKNPTADVLLKLSRALNVTIDFLVTGKKSKLEKQFEVIRKLPKSKQKIISDMLEAALDSE